MLLQGTDRFHHSTLKVVADTHHLSGSLHLRRQRTLCRDKFIKRESRNLDNTVIQHRLKARIRLSGDGVFYLVKSVAQRNFGGHFCDRVSGGLGRKRGRTGNSRVYLDDTVFECVRMKRILHITAARDL